MTNWSFLQLYSKECLVGIITTIPNTQGQHTLNKPFVLQCTGKVWTIPSQDFSKTVEKSSLHASQMQIDKLPTKLVIRNSWEALCVNPVWLYTINDKDKTEIDFVCLIMIDTATSWLEIAELIVAEASGIPMVTRGHEDTRIRHIPSLSH
jgi:hypothetical protein